MPVATLSFEVTQSSEEFSAGRYTATTEQAHGLARLEAERLVLQWRVHRSTTKMQSGYTTREEVDPVRELAIPLAQLVGADVERRRRWLRGRTVLVLRATDLRAFEALTGPDGLRLAHPSRLELTVARDDAGQAADFAAEVSMAVADRQLRLATEGAARELRAGDTP